MLDFKLDGDLAGALEQLDEALQTQVARAVAHAGALVYYGEARTLAPVYSGPARKGIRPGQLREAIYRAHSPELSTDTLQVYNISWNPKKAPHGHLVENGHWRVNVIVRVGNRIAATTERLETPVWVKPVAFIRRAGDAAPRALAAMQARAKERVAEVLADLAKGGPITEADNE
ncbi:hypothetical protein GCM10007242_41500 [Pigmentiphaga litoralis]|uniref:HK97 gp10 family phage protein n=1 Tax=Pigmentiphaga litoralis TaxID=516702 RepID=UPI001672138C|nr:HK97 gp10 family phage protein [Pigmentiphaga litoralis]GGX30546.1 hypothetical protein GCM10007242_41500 [Pigmentiphaga litoralis]